MNKRKGITVGRAICNTAVKVTRWSSTVSAFAAITGILTAVVVDILDNKN